MACACALRFPDRHENIIGQLESGFSLPNLLENSSVDEDFNTFSS